MTKKLAILDKDGTLVQTVSGEKFINQPDDQQLIKGVKTMVMSMYGDDWDFAIASNQGGIEAGHKTLESVVAEMRFCLDLIKVVNTAFFCPDMMGKRCELVTRADHHSITFDPGSRETKLARLGEIVFNDCLIGGFRKRVDGLPACGMLELAAMDYDDENVVMIGDREEDMIAAQQMGVKFWQAEDWHQGIAKFR
jgi:D-glycero-D-manno-heptose 1,7-bisphosphate phosphatase